MGFVGEWFRRDLPQSGRSREGGVQLGPFMSRRLPSGRAMEAVTEEAIHEACHRQATTFGFVEERGDEGTRDDRLVTGSVCHQRFMPRGRGLLREMRDYPTCSRLDRKRGQKQSDSLPCLLRPPAHFLSQFPERPKHLPGPGEELGQTSKVPSDKGEDSCRSSQCGEKKMDFHLRSARVNRTRRSNARLIVNRTNL